MRESAEIDRVRFVVEHPSGRRWGALASALLVATVVPAFIGGLALAFVGASLNVELGERPERILCHEDPVPCDAQLPEGLRSVPDPKALTSTLGGREALRQIQRRLDLVEIEYDAIERRSTHEEVIWSTHRAQRFIARAGQGALGASGLLSLAWVVAFRRREQTRPVEVWMEPHRLAIDGERAALDTEAPERIDGLLERLERRGYDLDDSGRIREVVEGGVRASARGVGPTEAEREAISRLMRVGREPTVL